MSTLIFSFPQQHFFSFFLSLFLFCHGAVFCQWDKLGHLIKLEWALWKNEAQILNLAWGSLPLYDCKGDNRPPYLPYRHTHKKEHGTKNAISMQILSTRIKKISIFGVIVHQTLCLLGLTFWFIYTFDPPPPLHCMSLFYFLLMCWLYASFVHWPECTDRGLFYPCVLLTLFIHVTSCPFASSSSVLCRDTDALDSRHIWVAQALIVCQPLRQHH